MGEAADLHAGAEAVLPSLTVLEVDTDTDAQFAGRALAAMGATVTLVEPDGGSRVRRLPPFARDEHGEHASVPFEALNAGKTVVTLEGAVAAHPAAVAQLAAQADLVLLGLEAWEAIGAQLQTPVVVVTSLYGLEHGGPPAPSSPFTRYAAGGDASFLPTSHDRSLRPTVPGRLTGEGFGGTGILLAALHGLRTARERGERQVVDYCQQAYLTTLNKMFVSQASYFKTEHSRFTHTYPFGGNVACADGYAAILVLETSQWHGLCHMVGAPEWIDDPRYADGILRRRNGEPLDRAIKAWCAQRSVAEVVAAGRVHDVPIGRVATPRDLLERPSLARRGFLRSRPSRFGTGPSTALPFGPRFGDSGSDGSVVRADDLALAAERPLRVLDLTWAGAGPIMSWTLASIGAQVAKVEHPRRPDLLRRANRTYGWAEDDNLDGSPAFNELNAGKRSVVVDLSTESGQAVVRRLAATCDVLCESMRPGKLESLGLGYDDVRRTNPSIVYCSLSATGRGTGEPADVSGYAPIFWAEGGGAWVSGWPEAAPDYVRSPVDMHAGSYACAGILAALERRASTGLGSYVDLSAIEAVTSTLGDVLLAAHLEVDDGARQGNARPPWIFNDVVPCAGDERWLAVSIADAEQWATLREVLGLAPTAPPSGSPTSAERARAQLAKATRAHPARALEARLQEHGIAASRVLTMRELLDDEGLLKRGYWQDIVHPVLGVQRLSGLAWRFAGAGVAALEPSPLLDADTDRILEEWLDLDEQEITRLRAEGAVGGTQAIQPTAA